MTFTIPEQSKLFPTFLVEVSSEIIEALWKVEEAAPSTTTPFVSPADLRAFVGAVLLRSKTTYSCLYLALLYLSRLKAALGPKLASFPPQNLFLISVVVANKYHQDSSFSNRSWEKITGVPTLEITQMERLFLRLVRYSLFVSEDEFRQWSKGIHSRTNEHYNLYVAKLVAQQRAALPAAAACAATPATIPSDSSSAAPLSSSPSATSFTLHSTPSSPAASAPSSSPSSSPLSSSSSSSSSTFFHHLQQASPLRGEKRPFGEEADEEASFAKKHRPTIFVA